MIIGSGNLTKGSLSGRIAIVTGAGRGIGYETARSLVWLGAKVVIAERDESTGTRAAAEIAHEFGRDCAFYQPTDVGDEASVAALQRFVTSRFGQADVVINNATITPMGSVIDVPIQKWDESYAVNLRGPVLLAKAFLPMMEKQGKGTFICVSSVGTAFMGAYESFKAAQQHLAETIAAEVEGSPINVFTVSPGLVRTPGAISGIEQLAPLYDMSVDAFFAMSEEHIITAEAAGAGMAAAVALADQFNGQEISCKQALMAAGIDFGKSPADSVEGQLTAKDISNARELVRNVRQTLKEQSDGWQQRSFFERQWMFRDFRKNAGMSVDGWLDHLDTIEQRLAAGRIEMELVNRLVVLAAYYGHMAELAKGYTSDQAKLSEQLAVISNWQLEVEKLHQLLTHE